MKTPPHPTAASPSEVKDLLQSKPEEPADARVNVKEATVREFSDMEEEYSRAQLRRLLDDNKALMKTPPHPTAASPSEVKDLLQSKPEEPADARVNVKEATVREFSDMEEEYSRAQLRRLLDDNKARKAFSQWIFALTVLWMFLVLVIVIQ